MKVLTHNEAQARALVKAFHAREQFTLIGAGMTAFFVAETLNNEPCAFGSDARELSLELTQISYPSDSTKWDGEGLPPVGLEVFLRGTNGHKRFKKHLNKNVRIVAHSTGSDGAATAVYQVGEGVKAEYHALIAGWFGPKRTPEELAVETTLADIEELYTEGGPAAVFDAGYRKFEGEA